MRVVRMLVSIAARMLPRRHAQRRVEADDFAVEIAVLDHVARERGELRRIAELFRERQRRGEAFLRLRRAAPAASASGKCPARWR